MASIIAGMYEIQGQIGAGGGGVVYMGRHIRLDKPVVLKADKRRLSTSKEALRREVDMLKGLSHTYIPQVYDFVQEDGMVYTVMDYIEGESMDKLLARKQRPSQAEIVRWAGQLLEALVYLHGQPPYGILHGDIKPANIMLRPQGDICLIDFNIALALGEDGAVKVGFSRGYASPEHYGADYLSENRPAAVGTASAVSQSGSLAREEDSVTEADTDATEADSVAKADTDKTEADDGETGQRGLSASADSRGTTGGKKGLKLDVRSDIYSLGATLYHLLSGNRPDQDAKKVIPLGPDVCSPAVAAIIGKAMAPVPSERYQTAAEMLKAFRSLHRNDERMVRHRRRAIGTAAALSALFLAGGGCALTGMRQMKQLQTSLTLAEYSANALAEGNVSEAVSLALQAVEQKRGPMDAPVTAQAGKALADALGVYDLSEGFKATGTVELPSAPFDLAISPKGTRFAAVYAWEVSVYDSGTGERIVSLPIGKSALSDCIFLDESRIVYAGEQGVSVWDLEQGKALWTGKAATTLAVSADGLKVAAVNGAEDRCLVYRTEDGTLESERSFAGRHLPVAYNDIFADPGNYLFAMNGDGSLLAVSFSDGGLFVCDLDEPEEDLILYEESDYNQFSGGFQADCFAFAARKSGEAVFGLVDVKEAAYLGGMQSGDSFLLQADERGIFLANGNLLVKLETGAGQGTFDGLGQRELAYTDNVNITAFAAGERYVLTATDDNCFAFYDGGANLSSRESGGENCDFTVMAGRYAVVGNRSQPTLRLLALEDHSESLLLSYDPVYSHDEARASGDGRTVMLFDYQRFRIYDMDGNILAQEELPEPERIYDQQFLKSGEGSWLEVIWYDGTVRRYSASDGRLLSEEKGQAVDKELYEEFFTERYRIASALHGAPEVYERKTGRYIATLEQDSYLTYVTEVGGYIITEYISAAGERYGILLNDRLEKLAALPGLCDVDGERLIFDYASGDLRQCRIYSLEELVRLGEGYAGDEKIR